MEVVHEIDDLERYMRDAVVVSGDNPVLIDGFLNNAIEVDIDALCDGRDVYIGGIMQHIEEAGIHSGDSACWLPPQDLPARIVEELREQTRALALALGVVGLMNVQFAIREDEIYLLEVNPRGSRTVPFVAKATGVPLAKIAARVMAGEKLSVNKLKDLKLDHVAVKEAVFPFSRFPGSDVVLGPEMKSTGEVMGIDAEPGLAFAKSQLGAGVDLPLAGTVFVFRARPGQTGHGRNLPRHPQGRFQDHRHRRHIGGVEGGRRRGVAHQQGHGGAPAWQGRHTFGRRADRVQHGDGRRVDPRFLLAETGRAHQQGPLLHHRFGLPRGHQGHRRHATRRTWRSHHPEFSCRCHILTTPHSDHDNINETIHENIVKDTGDNSCKHDISRKYNHTGITNHGKNTIHGAGP